jgi:hypothetical protein
MANRPTVSAKNVTGDSETFIKFMRKLVQVPHSEIKAALEAEKEFKRTSKVSSSRVSVARPKRAN